MRVSVCVYKDRDREKEREKERDQMISKVVEMDKKYNDSSIQWLMVKKSFDFAIYYLVALYYDLDLVLN